MIRSGPFPLRRCRPRRPSAFTVLEMLVSVAILVVIIFSLYQMFNQTQRAFRGGVTQVDVMEAGRAAVDLIANEVQQMAAAHQPDSENFLQFINGVIATPIRQVLPDGTVMVNELQEFYFLSRPNQRIWQAQGFFIQSNTPPTPPCGFGYGTLYRIRSNDIAITPFAITNFVNAASPTNTNAVFRICDGVIHFKLHPLRADGTEIPPANLPLRGDDIPSYLRIELGILDPPVQEYARTIPSLTAFTNFLFRRAGNVHVFHKTIHIAAALR